MPLFYEISKEARMGGNQKKMKRKIENRLYEEDSFSSFSVSWNPFFPASCASSFFTPRI
jgi:hypothetical protein